MRKISAIVVIFLVTFSTFPILTLNAKANNQPISTSAPVGYVPIVPCEKNGSATALLIEDVLPWSYDSDVMALRQLSISYDLKHSSSLSSVNLDEYKFIILASDQPTSTYINVASNIAKISSYVSGGGVYIVHACDWGWSNGDWSGLQIMPGGVTHVTRYPTMYIHITDPKSPIVAGLDDAYFAGWGYSAHGYFTDVPKGADTVMVTETSLGSGVPDLNKPTYITYNYGSGKVLATMQTIEWGWSGVYNWVAGYRKEFLPNELKYAPLFAKKGYIVLVSGDYQNDKKDKIDQATNQIYDDLLLMGYTGHRIYYLNKDSNSRVNATASSANLQSAITSWAATKVDVINPLFLIMFDHGGRDTFCVNNPAKPTDTVSAANLASWLDTLDSTGASIYVVYVACHSGSFIDNLSKSGRVIITSCNPDETSGADVAPYWEYFQTYFWPRIKMGLSLLDAFNPASTYAVNSGGYHPLLDDNKDGIGHGWDTPTSSGNLPHDGDGTLADNVYLTSSIWVYPQIDSVVATQFYTWPPPTSVNLWAEIENDTPLVNVTAWMLPPDWSPPPPNDVLVQAPLEPFNMTELGDSGNWTANIPADAFTAHATGPSKFRFLITATEANSSAIPFWTAVEFTSTGLAPPDTTAPQVEILRPKDMQLVEGTVNINGTATDDVSLQRVELYVNSSLAEVINVPRQSSFFFQFAYTALGTLSSTEFTVKTYDTSDNVGAQTIRVNTIRDMAVTDLTPYKNEIGQGSSLPINVTVANRGQLTEADKMLIYVNETLIQTRIITLESGASTTFTVVWNTTGFANGNYIIRAMASFLPYEINVADNEVDSIVYVGLAQYKVTFYQTGVRPDFMGTVITIDGKDYNMSSLPVSFSWESGSTHSFSYASSLSVSSDKEYVWSSTTGLSSLQSDVLTVTSEGSVTGNFKTLLTSNLNIHPQALNLKSKSKWLTYSIELPNGYNVKGIDISTILLNGTIPVDPTAPTAIGDYDGDGIPELVVNFNRTLAIAYLISKGITHANITLTLTGELSESTLFKGSSLIRVSALLGDVDCNGKVDLYDVIQAASIYGSTEDMPSWDPNADFAPSWNRIDIYDVVTIVANYGKTLP
jgi:hypothetical protein